jgi:hypothetical protein
MGMKAFLGKYNNLIYIQYPRIAKHKQRIETIAYYRITIGMDVYLFSRQKTNISSELSVVRSCAKKKKKFNGKSHIAIRLNTFLLIGRTAGLTLPSNLSHGRAPQSSLKSSMTFEENMRI